MEAYAVYDQTSVTIVALLIDNSVWEQGVPMKLLSGTGLFIKFDDGCLQIDWYKEIKRPQPISPQEYWPVRELFY